MIYTLQCEICQNEFNVDKIKKIKKTCSKECSYKLRNLTRNIKHESIIKNCIYCKEEFEDTSKKKLVLTCKKCIYEKMVNSRNEKGSYVRTDEQNKKMVRTFKIKREKGEIIYTEESREKLSRSLKERWENGSMKEKSEETCLKKYGVNHWTKSDEGKKVLSEKSKGRIMSIESRIKMSKAFKSRLIKNKIFSRAKGGFRKDINFYCRSTWEANYARILMYEKKEFLYESKTFTLKENMTYTPDFYHDNTWYEIKGYMDEHSKLKLRLFSEIYSDQKICIIGPEEYNILKEKYKPLIPNWEGK